MVETFMPLKGIRVIELSHMIMGPSAGQHLAFMGVEVLKVEPPGGTRPGSRHRLAGIA